jgi:hypothetical protein
MAAMALARREVERADAERSRHPFSEEAELVGKT